MLNIKFIIILVKFSIVFGAYQKRSDKKVSSEFSLVLRLSSEPKTDKTWDETKFEWKELSFNWPSETVKNEALQNGSYIPYNNLPLALAIWRNKLFVTVPRWRLGVASSLNYIDLNATTGKSPSLTPYPNWETHDITNINSNSIVSPFRPHVDACDRLWMVDTGTVNLLENPTQIVPYSIVVFDLTTDTQIFKYQLKSSDLKNDTFIANIVVDVERNNCNDAYAYLPDLGGYGLVVYSLRQNESWRFSHNFFHMQPLLGNMFIGGVNFQWNDGIFGLALGSKQSDGSRIVYFHPFISYNEFSVSSKTLKNQSLAENNDYYAWKYEGFKGFRTQSTFSQYDEQTSVLFMSNPNRNGIACWNTKQPLNPENFILFAQDNTTLIYVNDIEIDTDRNLWFISNKLPIWSYGRLNENEVNYRIFKIPVDTAIAGTHCKSI